MPYKKPDPINPFILAELAVKVQSTNFNLEGVIEVDAGHVQNATFSIPKIIDFAEYTKVFQSKSWVDRVLKLSRPAKDLFILLPHLLVVNQDWVELKQSYLESKLDLSKPSVIIAIRELKTISVLADKTRSEYWINPQVLFNGDRVKLYKKKGAILKVVSSKQLSLDFKQTAI